VALAAPQACVPRYVLASQAVVYVQVF